MDWAALRSRERGYLYWKAFTTGKSGTLGGFSHKEHGMTTQGVHQYVLSILHEVGVREDEITKVQTGGPDGDLGGNEILVSCDRTLAIVDSGGVLYDPAGLDRGELRRLAEAGLNSSAFSPRRLSAAGFRVGIHDRNVSLPDGTMVVSGLAFRNGFHLDPRFRADLFVPCGGRPKSINSTNWRALLDESGAPRFRWVVEGANLFFTQDARVRLEEQGVVIVKDSSSNKGGVISSSLEVVAALSLGDAEYAENMEQRNGPTPLFRGDYLDAVVATIRRKTEAEFAVLWSSHCRTGRAMSAISDELSDKINDITRDVEASTLFDKEALRTKALGMHLPAPLIKQVGIDALKERIPVAYQRAILARTLAGNFIYRFGLDATFEDYRHFIESLCQ